MPAIPLINGVAYSWANVAFTLFGVPVTGITKIDYNEKQKKENIYGFGDRPIQRGYGNYEDEGSIEILLDEWKRIIAASPDRNPLLIPPFDVQVVFFGTNVAPGKDVLRGVEFLENPLSTSQGDTSIKLTIPLIIASIER